MSLCQGARAGGGDNSLRASPGLPGGCHGRELIPACGCLQPQVKSVTAQAG